MSSAISCNSKRWANRRLTVQSLEIGIVNAAILDGILAGGSRPKGFNTLGEYSALKHQFLSQALVVQRSFLQQRSETLENLLKAEIEGSAYVLAPKNKPAMIRDFDAGDENRRNSSQEGYLDLLRGMERKPVPTVESMIHVQRLMKLQNPKIGDVKIEDSTMRASIKKLDDNGFIDKAYAAQGISAKP